MEFRPSPLPNAESEPDSLKEKVEHWIEEYTETHQAQESVSYEIAPEVGEWFAEYDNRYEKAREQAKSREEWRNLHTELQTEYDTKLKQKEYLLFALRKKGEGDELEARILQNRMLDEADRKWWKEHKDEIHPRNLSSHFHETATVMADIEGLGWAGSQSRENFSLLGALQYLEKYKQDPNATMYEIYGDGGFNRWFVNAKGEVLFGKNFAVGDKEKIAEKISTEILLSGTTNKSEFGLHK